MAENQKPTPKRSHPPLDDPTTTIAKTRKRRHHCSEEYGYAESEKDGADTPFGNLSTNMSAKKKFPKPLLKDLPAPIPAKPLGSSSVVSPLKPSPFKLPKSSPAFFVTPGSATPYFQEYTPGGCSPFHSLFNTPTVSRISDKTPVPAGSYTFDDPRFQPRPLAPPPRRTASEKAALSALRKRVAPTRVRKEQLDWNSSIILAETLNKKASPRKSKKRKAHDEGLSPNDPIASNNPLNVFTVPTPLPARGRSISGSARPGDTTTSKKDTKRRKTTTSSEQDNITPDQSENATPDASPRQATTDRSRMGPKVALTAGQKLIRESRAIERAKQRDIAQASRIFKETNAA